MTVEPDWETTPEAMEVYMLAWEALGRDADKAETWMETPNPMLGEVTPNDMLRRGRGDMLLRIVRETMAGL